MNDNIDYGASAELFPAHNAKRGKVSYRRFDTLAEALKYAVEDLQPDLLVGAFIEVDEARYSAAEMRALYDATGYPLERRPAP